MTKNNLRGHLNWLVSSNSFAPPTPGPTPPDIVASTSFISASEDPLHNHQSGGFDVSIYRQSDRDDVEEPFSQLVPLRHPDNSLSAPDTNAMARLQAGSSTRSKLLSHDVSGQLQTPTSHHSRPPSTSLRDQYTAPYEKATLSTAKKNQNVKPQLQTPAASINTNRLSKIETNAPELAAERDVYTSSSSTIEVFGEPRALWREDSATRKEPPAKRGKKRKSHELCLATLDASAHNGLPQDEFVAIDSFLNEDTPPLATATASDLLRPTGLLSTKKRRNDTAVKEEPQIDEPVAKAKHLPLTALISDIAANRRKSAVADSEEEVDEDLDYVDWAVKQKSDASPAAARPGALKSYLAPPASSSKTYPDMDGSSVRRRLTEWSSKSLKTDQNSQTHPSTQIRTGVSSFQRDSQTKITPSQQQSRQGQQLEFGIESLYTSSTGSRARTSILAFLELPPYRFREYSDGLEHARNASVLAAYQQLIEGSSGIEETQRRTALINGKIDAVKGLLQHREKYFKLSRQRDELKSRLLEALRTDQDLANFSSEIAEQQKNTEQLSQVEKEVLRLLSMSGIPLDEAHPLPCDEAVVDKPEGSSPNPRSTTLVQSTQAHQQHKETQPSRPRIPASSGPTTTQYIQQTQVPNITPLTPKRQRDEGPVVLHRTPIRTYASSPSVKDVNAYFSPSRRKAAQGPPRTNSITEKVVSAVEWRPTLDAGAKENFNAVDDDDDEPFTKVMGSPSRQDTEEDEYGQDDDDEDMLEVADELENRDARPSAQTDRAPRQVFAETSGNVVKQDLQQSRTLQVPSPPKLTQLQYRWSKDVKVALRTRFHLTGFRPHQLEAINATLSGKDTFVLMPTGGGKSLCYQLPAVIKTGHTQGVTVVISPLLSLMQDQVDHLRHLNVQAFLVNSEVTTEHRRLVMDSLKDPRVEKYIELLYITPEMISKSTRMIDAFRDLHRRQKLARIVIDEAHCVSQWGHDFRPDYKLLGEVRQKFPGVPVMALTATATENVKHDVIHNLNIRDCEVLAQSFNRPNLTYEVRSKGKAKDVLEDIARTINSLYRNQSGIIYCLSRQSCEKIAEQLRKDHEIKAEHYHAGMDPQVKKNVQKEWQAGKYNVIVATIAFGMGIDKPDVRFVIHHTIPKSLEGYYQETGRAGRDGKRSGCYLYYGYQDTSALKRMIDDGEGSQEQKNRQRGMLRSVVQYCENKSDCRRVQVLGYFSEQFRPEDCNAACDNCNSQSVFQSEDFTGYAKSAIQLVRQIEHQNVTLLHCVDVFRGGKSKKIADLHHNDLKYYGAGSDLERGDVERLFYRLLGDDALEEQHIMNKAGFASQYVHLGRKSSDFLNGHRKINIQIRVSPNGKSLHKSKKPKQRDIRIPAARQEYPQSTNVSSPVQAATKRRNMQKAKVPPELAMQSNAYTNDSEMSDKDNSNYEPGADSDDAFQPMSELWPTREQKRMLGPPITTDEKMRSLNPTHQYVVDDFMVQAAKENEKLLFKKGLRAQPFTDTVLREMAITFPQDQRELLRIPGIAPEMAGLYGNRFLKLVRQAQRGYKDMMQQQQDPPLDPNHQNVIDISSDEDYGDDAELDELANDDAHEEQSAYFRAAPDVEAFNAKFSQIPSLPMAPPTRPQSQSRTSGRGGYARGGSKRDGKRASGSFRKGRRSSKSGQTSTSGRSDGTSSRGASSKSRGGDGGRGIAVMPT